MKENKNVFSVTTLCEVMKLSTSSYYRWLHKPISKRQQNDADLDQAIIQIFNDHKSRYGSVRIYDTLKDNGWQVTQSRVSKRMRILGLQAKASKRFTVTTDSNHNKEVADNLLDQNFNVLGVNHMGYRYHIHSNKGRMVVFVCNYRFIFKSYYWLVYG